MTSDKGVLREIGITVLEVRAGAIKGRKDPLVRIIEGAVVVVKILVVDVWASWAIVVHLSPCSGAKASDGTAVVIVYQRIIGVWILGTVDSQATACSKAANGLLKINSGKRQGTNPALNV